MKKAGPEDINLQRQIDKANADAKNARLAYERAKIDFKKKFFVVAIESFRKWGDAKVAEWEANLLVCEEEYELEVLSAEVKETERKAYAISQAKAMSAGMKTVSFE